ncbi:unnamed protein product [Paramecium primaurelia]|uniref:Uncharacterized protein n=1 Tax=Paramecium primaurelia TaxID=5886 RepID=A0A8S1LMM1_PARPR|nr:unnamed protein product [Paramecium primaurelia]
MEFRFKRKHLILTVFYKMFKGMDQQELQKGKNEKKHRQMLLNYDLINLELFLRDQIDYLRLFKLIKTEYSMGGNIVYNQRDQRKLDEIDKERMKDYILFMLPLLSPIDRLKLKLIYRGKVGRSFRKLRGVQ